MSNTTVKLKGQLGRASEDAAVPIVDHVRVAGFDFSSLSEAEVIGCVIRESTAGRGGWIATPNVDICRKSFLDPAIRDLVRNATLIVPDGMPLIWAARLSGQPLPERVSGSSLIDTLSCAAASAKLSVYLLGGAPGVPEKAAIALGRRYPGLRVAGTNAPPFGFDRSSTGMSAMRERIRTAQPDIVFVGLGFPKQERVIAELTAVCPRTWFVGCGAAITFAAGTLSRAPEWMQGSGLEWLFRLLKEPRRLFRRYLIEDLPFAVKLLAETLARRGWRTLTKPTGRSNRADWMT
jgi:N-acetylglucosaminyldiphosphoundecaprenol N-acetyl-beta-D-mannosaminyltransferase